MLNKQLLVALLVLYVAVQEGLCVLCFCVKASGVRIRKEPNDESTILGLAYPGDCYYELSSDEENGFMALDYYMPNGKRIVGYSFADYWENDDGCTGPPTSS